MFEFGTIYRNIFAIADFFAAAGGKQKALYKANGFIEKKREEIRNV